MSNFAITNQTTLLTATPSELKKTDKPVVNTETKPTPALNKDQLELSGKSVGKVAAVSLLGGGAIAGAGGLLIHSAKHLTGTGAFGATFLGIGLLGVGALTALLGVELAAQLERPLLTPKVRAQPWVQLSAVHWLVEQPLPLPEI